jgi:hypothetical protein
MVLLAAALFAACGSAPAQTPVDLTGVTSYYVRANGNDSNAGTSEDAPFKTLERAVRAASGTSVKTITVIGTLDGQTEIKDSGADQILITGKAGASDSEKAVLTISAERTNTIKIAGNSNIRLECLTVTGPVNTLSFIYADGNDTKLTLGRDAVILGNGYNAEYYRPNYGGGILVINGTLTMLDNAMVTNCFASAGGGVAVAYNATLIMQDNAVISNNIAGSDHFDNGGGGGIYSLQGKIILRDNAKVTGNTANHAGGIILRFSSIETADNLQIQGSGLYESRQVSGNTATGTWLDNPGGNNIRVHNQ